MLYKKAINPKLADQNISLPLLSFKKKINIAKIKNKESYLLYSENGRQTSLETNSKKYFVK